MAAVTIRLSVVGVTLGHMTGYNEMNPGQNGVKPCPSEVGPELGGAGGGAETVADTDRVDWDAEADTFDDEPDHGLRDAVVREAWAERLRAWLPETPCEVLDLGCGTAAWRFSRPSGATTSPGSTARHAWSTWPAPSSPDVTRCSS